MSEMVLVHLCSYVSKEKLPVSFLSKCEMGPLFVLAKATKEAFGKLMGQHNWPLVRL